jgi:predicted nucleic acid-binding protein
MTPVILDSEAVNLLASRRAVPGQAKVRNALASAARTGSRVLVPANVLSELYRSTEHNQRVDSCLGRHTGIEIIPTDRDLAKIIGGILGAAGLGSAHNVDATVVALAVSRKGGYILTADADDLTRLAATQPSIDITIEPL